MRIKPYNKYNAKKTEYNGVVYASIREAEFAKKLDLLVAAKEIKSWERQVPFVLLGKYTNGAGKKVRAIKMIIDFEVTENDGRETLYDAKGQVTTDWKLKKKLFENKFYPRVIHLV